MRVPDGVDGKEVQGRVLKEHDVEIGGGLGPDAPAIWRLGLMGHNARREAADQVLAALDAVLADTKHARADRLTVDARRIAGRARRAPAGGAAPARAVRHARRSSASPASGSEG